MKLTTFIYRFANFVDLFRFIFFFISTITITSIARADYAVSGEVKATICRSYIFFEKCKTERVDAVKKDDELFHLPDSFSSVDDFRDGRCWIRIRSGFLNKIIGDIPIFIQYTGDESNYLRNHIELSAPDSITFKCQRQ